MEDYDLAKRRDEELIAYVVAARDAGELDSARQALGIFAQRRWGDLVRRALLKMPTREDAEDVAAQAIAGALKAAFDGESIGEAVNLINRILSRRIADFHEARKRTEALPEDLDDDERKQPDAAIVEDDTAAVDLADVVTQVYDKLEEDHHRDVVDDYVFGGFDAKETAERVNTSYPDLDPPMSDQNVHQIASRFRKDLRDELSQ